MMLGRCAAEEANGNASAFNSSDEDECHPSIPSSASAPQVRSSRRFVASAGSAELVGQLGDDLLSVTAAADEEEDDDAHIPAGGKRLSEKRRTLPTLEPTTSVTGSQSSLLPTPRAAALGLTRAFMVAAGSATPTSHSRISSRNSSPTVPRSRVSTNGGTADGIIMDPHLMMTYRSGSSRDIDDSQFSPLGSMAGNSSRDDLVIPTTGSLGRFSLLDDELPPPASDPPPRSEVSSNSSSSSSSQRTRLDFSTQPLPPPRGADLRRDLLSAAAALSAAADRNPSGASSPAALSRSSSSSDCTTVGALPESLPHAVEQNQRQRSREFLCSPHGTADIDLPPHGTASPTSASTATSARAAVRAKCEGGGSANAEPFACVELEGMTLQEDARDETLPNRHIASANDLQAAPLLLLAEDDSYPSAAAASTGSRNVNDDHNNKNSNDSSGSGIEKRRPRRVHAPKISHMPTIPSPAVSCPTPPAELSQDIRREILVQQVLPNLRDLAVSTGLPKMKPGMLYRSARHFAKNSWTLREVMHNCLGINTIIDLREDDLRNAPPEELSSRVMMLRWYPLHVPSGQSKKQVRIYRALHRAERRDNSSQVEMTSSAMSIAEVSHVDDAAANDSEAVHGPPTTVNSVGLTDSSKVRQRKQHHRTVKLNNPTNPAANALEGSQQWDIVRKGEEDGEFGRQIEISDNSNTRHRDELQRDADRSNIQGGKELQPIWGHHPSAVLIIGGGDDDNNHHDDDNNHHDDDNNHHDDDNNHHDDDNNHHDDDDGTPFVVMKFTSSRRSSEWRSPLTQTKEVRAVSAATQLPTQAEEAALDTGAHTSGQQQRFASRSLTINENQKTRQTRQMYICNFLDTEPCKRRMVSVVQDSGYLPLFALFKVTDKIFGSYNTPYYFCQFFINQHGLAQSYEEMFLYCGEKIAVALKLITTVRPPILFHCSLGKDRTGILAALILHTLGASDEAIAHDYSLSQQTEDANFDRFIYKFIVKDSGLREDFCRAREMDILAPLAALRSKYGTISDYMTEIGFTRKWQSRLRRKFLLQDSESMKRRALEVSAARQQEAVDYLKTAIAPQQQELLVCQSSSSMTEGSGGGGGQPTPVVYPPATLPSDSPYDYSGSGGGQRTPVVYPPATRPPSNVIDPLNLTSGTRESLEMRRSRRRATELIDTDDSSSRPKPPTQMTAEDAKQLRLLSRSIEFPSSEAQRQERCRRLREKRLSSASSDISASAATAIMKGQEAHHPLRLL